MSDKDLRDQARREALDRMLELLVPTPTLNSPDDVLAQTRAKFREKLESGALNERRVELLFEDRETSPKAEIDFPTVMKYAAELLVVSQVEFGPLVRETLRGIENLLDLGRSRTKQEKTVAEALSFLEEQELEKLRATATKVDYSSTLSFPSNEIVLAQKSLLEVLRKNPKLVYAISHREFEEFIWEYLTSLGFEVALTAQTRDGGCDLIALSQDKLGISTRYVIEAKHYKPENKVGVRTVRQLSAVRQKFGAHHGVLVTSSFFTQDAVEENAAYYGLHLEDYHRIVEWFKK